jgi:hypothetical protein
MPYCEIHYHAKRGSLCAGCHKPITGNVIFSFLFFFLKKEISYTPNTRAGKQQQQQEQAFNLIFLLYLNLPFLYYNTIIITRHTMWMNLLFVYCSFVSLFCFVFSQKNEIRSLHHCHVQEISPGTLCLLLLPETVEKGHVQRARRQALLSRMFRAPFRMNIVVVFSGSPNKCGRNNNNKKKTTNDKMIWNLGWERGGSTRETRRRIRTFSIKMYTITK